MNTPNTEGGYPSNTHDANGRRIPYIVSLLVIMNELFLYSLQISHEGVWYSYTLAVGSFYLSISELKQYSWSIELLTDVCFPLRILLSLNQSCWGTTDVEPSRVISRLLVRSFPEESLICIMRVVKASLLSLLYDAVCWAYSLCQNPSYVRFICKETHAYLWFI